MSEQVIEARRAFSDGKLSDLRRTIQAEVPALKTCPDLCVYATGSFARRDAGKHSDIDLFFVTDVADSTALKPPVPKIKQILINADLIRLCARMGFPDFSGDGQYLQILTLNSLVNELGSQKEDYENFFTARLLLLLESSPLSNDTVYDDAVTKCVWAYYQDFHDHAGNFRPVFLANDIVRFWKTLCLNYEHKRNRKDKGDEAKRKSHLKNFKLKFSRLLTCFSMVAALCDPGEADHPDKVIRLVKMTPLGRLEAVAAKHGLDDILREMKTLYDWFLQETDRTPEAAEAWIAEAAVRRVAFPKAEQFGDLMFQLLGAVASKSQTTLRYLVV